MLSLYTLYSSQGVACPKGTSPPVQERVNATHEYVRTVGHLLSVDLSECGALIVNFSHEVYRSIGSTSFKHIRALYTRRSGSNCSFARFVALCT